MWLPRHRPASATRGNLSTEALRSFRHWNYAGSVLIIKGELNHAAPPPEGGTLLHAAVSISFTEQPEQSPLPL